MSAEEVIIHPRYKGPLKTLKVGNQVFKSAFDCELTEEDLEKARRELGETEEKKEQCLRELKEKLSKESNVKVHQDDFYLLRYLRVRKYDVTKAFKNVMLYYEQRRKQKDWFTISPEVKSLQALNVVTCLPYTDEEGRIILWLNLSKWNPHELSFEEIIGTAANVVDIVSMNPKCQINGVVGIYDFSGLTLKHVTEILKKGRLYAASSVIIFGYPWRIKKGIYFNANRFVRFLFRLVKPLLQHKLVQRSIFLGTDLNELHQHVNPVLLPKCLQGTLEDEECDISQHVLNNMPYLKYERAFGYL